jgi:prephenate dehydrogenase
MDVGSTKSKILEGIKDHPKRHQFVASHPMSGTENSGPLAAFPDLFQKKMAILCEKENSDPIHIQTAEALYKALGSDLVYMNASEHDEHVGYVSHLSHVISFALAVSVLEKEKSTSTIFDLAAGGFASTARLAKSSAAMWTPIFQQNAENILAILEVYMGQLERFRHLLKNGETHGLQEFISQANQIRKVLDKR